MEFSEVSACTLLSLFSFLLWSSLYVWCTTREPKQSPEWCSRVVTLLHGSIAATVGLALCGVTNITECRLTAKLTPQHYALMVWSWGYFAFDLLWCLIYWYKNWLMLAHHACALAAITLYLNKEDTGCIFPCTMAMMEITNPLLQTRWFLKAKGHDKSIIYFLVEVLYLAMFITLRGVLGTYIIYKAVKSNIFDKETKIISIIFYIVSLAFINEIFGYVFYKYKTKIGEFSGFLNEMGIILNDHN